MKTLVMTTIFVVTVVINAFGGNIQENFAYNEVMNGNQVESQIVYKVENGKFLQNHLKYNFTYDAQGRTIQKEALRWNEIEQAFERFYCLNYKVTTKKRNAERYSDRIELQGFQSCFRLFVKPSQSPLKPNQDAATLLVRNHARNGDKRTRITKQGVKD